MKTNETIMTKVGSLIACVGAIAVMLGSGCTRAPNQKDGIIELEAATGTIAVSPGDFKTLKEKIPLSGSGVSRSYLKSGDKETVRLTGSESNTAIFETGAAPGTADIRIKGSKRFVDKIISEVQSIIDARASMTRRKLIAETGTYAGFKQSHVSVLEKELDKTMTSLGRSSSSVNQAVTIKCAFEDGLNGVRLKYSGEDSSLRITIEGDQEFADGVKALVNKAQDSSS